MFSPSYLLEVGSNYTSLAVSISCIVNKITSEDTESEIHKHFFRKSFGDFTGKTPVLESLFKKIGPATLLKKTPTRVFSCKICEIFKNTFF